MVINRQDCGEKFFDSLRPVFAEHCRRIMVYEHMKKVIIVCISIFLCLAGCTLRKEIVIPRAKLQEAVSKKFPYDKDIGIARFALHSPEVYFKGKNIGLKAVYSANLLDKQARGTFDINGNIVYKPETGSFYLHDFAIADITVNQKDMLEKINIRKVIDTIINTYLDGFLVYRLNPRDHKESLARSYVKEIFVRNDDLVVVLGY